MASWCESQMLALICSFPLIQVWSNIIVGFFLLLLCIIDFRANLIEPILLIEKINHFAGIYCLPCFCFSSLLWNHPLNPREIHLKTPKHISTHISTEWILMNWLIKINRWLTNFIHVFAHSISFFSIIFLLALSLSSSPFSSFRFHSIFILFYLSFFLYLCLSLALFLSIHLYHLWLYSFQLVLSHYLIIYRLKLKI